MIKIPTIQDALTLVAVLSAMMVLAVLFVYAVITPELL